MIRIRFFRFLDAVLKIKYNLYCSNVLWYVFHINVLMIIKFQELPPIGTNAYALIEPDRKECLIFDAPTGAFEWATKVAKDHDCKISGLILTHGHWDHILDGHRFVKADIPTYGHSADRELFEEPEKMTQYAIPGVEFLPVSINHWIKGGDNLNLLGGTLEIRHVPGHCPGNILAYLASDNLVIVGDAIFADSIGRYDLPGGDLSVLEKSIKTQIYTLPDKTTIYPGHGVSTTVEQEKRSNPYVRA